MKLKMLFVDPHSEIYINIPNMSLAYAATIYNAPVIDQHILPYPKDRFMKKEHQKTSTPTERIKQESVLKF